jgi:hypothetical protein
MVGTEYFNIPTLAKNIGSTSLTRDAGPGVGRMRLGALKYLLIMNTFKPMWNSSHQFSCELDTKRSKLKISRIFVGLAAADNVEC